MTLQGLSLSRSTLDRAAHRRSDDGLVPRLLADPGTAVLVLNGDRAPTIDSPQGPQLVLLDPRSAEPLHDGAPSVAAYLGEDAHGKHHVAIAAAPDLERPAPDGAKWSTLREVGTLLDDTDAGILTTSVALAHWHATHPRCSRCGEPTEQAQAGWARQCPACDSEHYPRTDPAVIMAIQDEDDRLLLGRQAQWPPKRFSTLAGFVEPGESLEAAVRREVFEEAGVRVGDVEYLGSQPWPFPSSLMLGFRGTAMSVDITVDGDELSQARWWTREEFSLDVATGELLLPPPVSIARRLIEHWYGGEVHAADTWR